jgi:hypothetical protein
MKPFKILTDDYFVGNFGSVEATDDVLKNCKINFPDDDILNPGGLGSAGVEDHSIRKCKTKGISISQVNFIEQGLRNTIRYINDMKWKMDLKHKWESSIQYTRYIGKGDFYGWHKDNSEPTSSIGHRKISIVYCLSYEKDYTGAEFEIKASNGNIYRRKFNYGDFIVFPSDKLHRVNPLKSGSRTTLVGWYM